MLRQHYFFLSTIIVCLPSLSNAFFCPTNFNQINFGFSTEQVQAICGKPDKDKTEILPGEGPQEWNYFVPQTVISSNNIMQMPGTLKTSFTFDKTGRAINISVNGIGVGSTAVCGPNLQLGDTRDTVKAACGTPSLINKQNDPQGSLGAAPPSITVVTYFYHTNPPVKLIFENNKLISKE